MSILAPHFFWLLLPLLYLVFKKRVTTKGVLLLISSVFLILALSQIVIKEEPVDSKQQFSDAIIALDLSASMMATDIEPSRLDRAKEIITKSINNSHNMRFAILGFSSNAIVLSPFTGDKEILQNLFLRLDEKMIIAKSTQILSALELAAKMKENAKVIIFSDGGDESDFSKEIAFAKKHNMQISVVMLASKFGSTLKDYKGELLKDASSNIVVTKANENIKSLTSSSGGEYIDEAYESELSKLFTSFNKTIKSVKIEKNIQLFYYFAALSLIFALLSFTTLSKRVSALLFTLFAINLDASMLSSYYLYEAKKSYEAKEYLQSASYFAKIDTDEALYNSAIAYYEAGLFNEALESFEKISASSKEFQADIFYNMGLCYFKLDQKSKARELFLDSLSLSYSDETLENILYLDAQQKAPSFEMKMQSSKKSKHATQESDEKKKSSSGGSSNMSAENSSGSDDWGDGAMKKATSSSLLIESAKAPLSSTQYELINERRYDESNPW